MDTEKWKSILVPKDVYLEIKKIAAKEGRTLGGQLRFIYSQYVSEEQKRVKELVDAEMTLRKAKDHSVAGSLFCINLDASTPILYKASVIGPSDAFLPLPDKKTSTGVAVSG